MENIILRTKVKIDKKKPITSVASLKKFIEKEGYSDRNNYKILEDAEDHMILAPEKEGFRDICGLAFQAAAETKLIRNNTMIYFGDKKGNILDISFEGKLIEEEVEGVSILLIKNDSQDNEIPSDYREGYIILILQENNKDVELFDFRGVYSTMMEKILPKFVNNIRKVNGFLENC